MTMDLDMEWNGILKEMTKISVEHEQPTAMKQMAEARLHFLKDLAGCVDI